MVTDQRSNLNPNEIRIIIRGIAENEVGAK